MNGLKRALALAPEGPRLELGVFRGASLRVISRHSGITVGFDSFEGMPQPYGRDDYPGNPYPKGRLKADISSVNLNAMQPETQRIKLVKGWVPKDLPRLEAIEDRWAFVNVDLDHLETSLAAFFWAWDRLLPGGVLCSHDYVPSNGRKLAYGAITDFSDIIGKSPDHEGMYCWWRKE